MVADGQWSQLGGQWNEEAGDYDLLARGCEREASGYTLLAGGTVI